MDLSTSKHHRLTSSSSRDEQNEYTPLFVQRNSSYSMREAELEKEIWEKGWINNDIEPIDLERRTWTAWTYTQLSILSNTTIATYMMGSAFLAIGLNWWQSLIAVTIGSSISVFFLILNGTPGMVYQLGFPVTNRYIWGIHGSLFVVLNRVMLSLVWYGFQAWVGGESLYVCLHAILPDIEERIPNTLSSVEFGTTTKFICYITFNIISLPLVWIHPHKLKNFFRVTSISACVFFVALTVWAFATMPPDGLSLSQPMPTHSIAWTITRGSVSMVGAIAAGILNSNDYTRFSRSPREAFYGQLYSGPASYILCCAVGIFVTAATQHRFQGQEPTWGLTKMLTLLQENDPTVLTRTVVFLSGVALVVSQIGINIPGNSLSGGFDMAALFPRYITIRRGAYLTAILSPIFNPWRLINTATVFINVMGSYSVFLGPMVGLMVSSYYLVHQQKLKIVDLYVRDSRSIYWFTRGIDWRAPVAWGCGVAPHIPGFTAMLRDDKNTAVVLVKIYELSFLSGFLISAFIYAVLHRIFPNERLQTWIWEATQTPQSPENGSFDESGDQVFGAVKNLGRGLGTIA